MPIPAPFISTPMSIKPEWIDHNGHLNMAYYSVLFDEGVEDGYQRLGFGPDYRESHKHTTYTAEFHIRYVRELHLGDLVTVSMQMIDHNDKSFHLYQEIRHQDGWLAATAEGLGLHIDMTGPRVARFPEHIAQNVADMLDAHSVLPRPANVGQGIRIRRK